jgi:ribosomal protein S18 acetylase RimI-like enzyme
MNWTIRAAEPADATVLPPLEASAGQRYRSIPHLAWLADGEDMPTEVHDRHIAQGTEWVASSETGELVAFLAAEIIHDDLHIWEFAVRADVQCRGIGRRLVEVATDSARDDGCDRCR